MPNAGYTIPVARYEHKLDTDQTVETKDRHKHTYRSDSGKDILLPTRLVDSTHTRKKIK